MNTSNLKFSAELSFGTIPSGNYLMQGDNLSLLKLLNNHLSRSIKCIYLDPPYNNGESYKHYYDSMDHKEWINSLKNRLSEMKSLLTEDGSVWISIDDSELHYLKVAADEVFERSNFITTIVWERRTTRDNRVAFSKNHEYILVYAKNFAHWCKSRNSLPLPEDVKNRYKNPDNDHRGNWQSVSANVQAGHAVPQQFYTIQAPNGKLHNPPKGRCWVYTKEKMQDEIKNNNVWFGKTGNSVPRLKRFLRDRKEGITPETLWRAEEVGTTSIAKKQLLALFKKTTLFDTPKPEQLIYRILKISTNEGDLILDPYLGSGTTTAVAHKMHRKYIGIEIGDHIKSHCVPRMRSVIKGEKGGISQDLNWGGGGGFEFFSI
jgi:adenine-specific DNA-methyltransferase